MRLLLLVSLVMGFPAAQVARAGLEDNVILYLSFDDGPGDVVKDLSGKGNDGKVIGAEWVEGKTGGGIQVAKAGQYVDIPHNDSLNVDKNVTICVWVNVNYDSAGSGHYSGFVAGSNTAFGEGADEGWGTESLNIAYRPDGTLHNNTKHGGTWSSELNIPVQYKAGEWHHAALTLDGTTRKLYFDGKEVGSNSTYNHPTDLMWSIGHGHRGGAGGSEYLDGVLDEVYIFDTTLTEGEIADVMNGKLAGMLLHVEPRRKIASLWGAVKTLP